MRYRAFISYSHKDAAIAKRLHNRLEGYRPPRGLVLASGAVPERLYPIYRDRDEMAAAPSLPSAIEAALAASDNLIVLCSPASAASAWVNEEIRVFAKLRGGQHIYPVIVEADPPACFPPALLEHLSEPLAPDLRTGKDGFADGVLKTIAGLWDVSLGTLKDREAVRQRRKARLNTALAAVFSGIAVFAGFSEWRAIEQAERARAEAQLSEARSLASIAGTTFAQNPGETSVAAMIAVRSLKQHPTPEAGTVLREALSLAPAQATKGPFPWQSPQTVASRNGKVAAFLDSYTSEAPPARSEIVHLTRDFGEQDRLAFDGLAEPVLSPDDKWLVATGHLRRVMIKNVSNGEIVLNLPIDSGLSAKFTSDGATLYAATQLGKVWRWSPGKTSPEELASTPPSGQRGSLPRLSLSSDNLWLAHAGQNQSTQIISTRDGSFRNIPFSKSTERSTWRGHAPLGGIMGPSGDELVVFDTINKGALLDAETLQTQWTFSDENLLFTSVHANAISDDGSYYARGNRMGAIIIRDMSDGTTDQRLEHGGRINRLTFLGQSDDLVAAGEGGASIWSMDDPGGAKRCATDATVLSIAAEPKGQSFLIGTESGRLIRCDAVSGKALSAKDFGAPITSITIGKDTIAIALKLSEYSDNWTEFAFVELATDRAIRFALNEPFAQISLSPNGAYAATRSWALKEIAIWNTATGALINRFAAQGEIAGLTSDGAHLLMDYKALDVFEVATGKRNAQLGEDAGAWSIKGKPYDDILIIDGEVDDEDVFKAWNTRTSTSLWQLPGDATVSADGAIYALHNDAKTHLQVYDRASETLIGTIPHRGNTWDADLSADGKYLATIDQDRKDQGLSDYNAEIWDVRTQRMLWSRFVKDMPGAPANFIPLTTDRALFLSGTWDETQGRNSRVDLIDIETGTALATLSFPYFATVTDVQIDHRAQSVLIAVPGETALFNLSNGALIWTKPVGINKGIAFAPDDEFVAVSIPLPGDKHAVRILDSASGDIRREWVLEYWPGDVAITANGQHVIAALSNDDWAGLHVWRIDDGTLVYKIPMDAEPHQLHPLAEPHLVAVRDNHWATRLFDIRDGRETGRLPMSVRATKGMFSADGSRAVTVSAARIRYWDALTGEEIDTMAANASILATAMTADGTEVAFSTTRKRKGRGGATSEVVEIWRPGTDQPVETLAIEKPQRLAYDPTGTVLAIGSGNNLMRVLDARTLAPRFTIAPLENGKFKTALSAIQNFTGDGRHLAMLETGSYGQGNTSNRRAALRVFNVQSGSEVTRLDVQWPGRVTPTMNGFFYADQNGHSRHFTLGEVGIDRVILAERQDNVQAVPGSDLIFASSYRNEDALVDIRTGKQVILPKAEGASYTVDSAIDPGGRYIVRSQLREIADQPQVYEVSVIDAQSGAVLARTSPVEMPLRNVEFAQDSNVVVVSNYSENSRIVDPRRDAAVFRWHWRDGALQTIVDDNLVADFEISANGQWMITSEGGRNDQTGETFGIVQSRLWNLADNKPVATIANDLANADLIIGANGSRVGLFSAHSPLEGNLFDISSDGTRTPVLDIPHEDMLTFGKAIGLIRNDTVLVASERSGARLYDLTTGAIQRMRVPGQAKRSALSPDGAYLAIGGDDFVSVWDLATAERVSELEISNLYRFAFAGTDMRDLIAIADGKVINLRWQLDDLVDRACKTYGDSDWQTGFLRITAIGQPDICTQTP